MMQNKDKSGQKDQVEVSDSEVDFNLHDLPALELGGGGLQQHYSVRQRPNALPDGAQLGVA